MTISTIVSTLAIFALPSSRTGSITSIPAFFSFSIFSIMKGFLYMLSCMAGTIITGMPEPMAEVTVESTGVSSIPQAILLRELPVAGATSTRSQLSSCSPASQMCSILPVNSVTTGLPVAHSSIVGVTSFVASSLITTNTSAPWRMSPRASSTLLRQPTLPVMHRAIRLS